MTRDELEAEVRRALTQRDRARDALADQHAARDNVFVDCVLSAADAYAIYTHGITADRRDAIDPVPGAVHFRCPIACGSNAIDPRWTGDYTRVTCGRCKRSGPWRNAAESAGKAAAS